MVGRESMWEMLTDGYRYRSAERDDVGGGVVVEAGGLSLRYKGRLRA
jgi:hypothetical protein